jgi:hypothetical protein
VAVLHDLVWTGGIHGIGRVGQCRLEVVGVMYVWSHYQELVDVHPFPLPAHKSPSDKSINIYVVILVPPFILDHTFPAQP